MSWHNDYIHIPFVDRGRERTGADCWGLARIIYDERLGILLPRLDHYQNTLERDVLNQIVNEERKSWVEIADGQEGEYDIIILNMVGRPMHIGVVVRPGYMIHCQHGAGTTFESYKTHRWKNKIEGFCRYANSTSDITALQSPS